MKFVNKCEEMKNSFHILNNDADVRKDSFHTFTLQTNTTKRKLKIRGSI